MPEGAIYTGHVAVVLFLMRDSSPGFAIMLSSDLHVATAVGYLEFAKASLMEDDE